jgi:hypothetical protein
MAEDFVHALVFPNREVRVYVPLENTQPRSFRCQPQPFFALAQFLFRQSAWGDILNDCNEVIWRAVRVAHQGNSQVNPHEGTILAVVSLLYQIGLNLACKQPLHLPRVFSKIVRMRDLGKGLPHQIATVVTDNVAQSLVDLEPTAV